MDTHIQPPINRKKQPLRLPFAHGRRQNMGGWIYSHRVGLLSAVVVQLTFLILFLTYRIIIEPQSNQAILMEFVEQPSEPVVTPEELEQQKIEELEQMRLEKVSNRASDENSKFNSSLRDAKNTKADEIYKEVERVQSDLQAGKSAYERGLNELASSAKKKPNTQDDNLKQESVKGDKNQRENVKGLVTVSYNLPGRTDTYLHIPAYQCQGGGQVVVGITVNVNGRVVSASVEQSTSVDDPCILDMAVKAARASTFNASSAQGERQKGTITYIFMPQ
ncbi:MAG: energy transducer TonB [Mucinivorans sp.]